MRNLFITINLLFAAILVICTIIKMVYFKNSGRARLDRFIMSFFKQYSTYRLNDSSSEARRVYMRVSNRINYIWWAVWVLAVVAFIIYRKMTH